MDIILSFRISHAKLKGVFNVECLIAGEKDKKETSSIIIGNSNVVNPYINNWNDILRDRKISLKYYVK